MRCFNRRPRVLCKEARNNPGFSCKTRLIQAAPAWPLIVMSIKTSGEQLSLSSFSHCVEHPRRHERATRVDEMRMLLRRSVADPNNCRAERLGNFAAREHIEWCVPEELSVKRSTSVEGTIVCCGLRDFVVCRSRGPGMVKVINRRNGKSVTVRINDRGPFIQGRVIDVARQRGRRWASAGSRR